MRALVTGGTGFVGSAVVRRLLAEGIEVVCLVRPTSDLRNLEGLEVLLLEGDLLDRVSLRRALAGCQQVYHVAAYYSTRPQEAELMFQVNVQGTRNLLEEALAQGVERIVHTSTIGTIGRPLEKRLPTEEDIFCDWERASPYVRSKLEAENLALEMARQGAPIVVVNPCAPVGPRDIKPSSTGQRILDYLRGKEPSFLPGGINFVAVEDVAWGHLLAARRGRFGERYILGNSRGNLTREGFYALMERVSGVRPPGPRGVRKLWQRAKALGRGFLLKAKEEPSAPSYRPEALTADPSRAIRELGLPQMPLEVAFRQAVEWFRRHGYV
ncbi:MAG: NAD-dependent epimerase/dehydratase family protein [Anaerolineae bacterium]|nr:NAD-dependent epimerase/dehydratase family protein [Anaerolineae bacterium]